MTRRAFLAGLARPPTGHAGEPAHHTVWVGAMKVDVITWIRGAVPFTYVHLHENEVTARHVLNDTMRSAGGRAVCLEAQRVRLITFVLDGQRFIFDPNRIFTDRGLAHTLWFHGPYSSAAHDAVAALAATIVRFLRADSSPIIVALHNNAGGGYSIRSYVASGRQRTEAERVSVGRPGTPHDFILVTQRPAFERLAARGLNVVLLGTEAPDDGSLSVYCQCENLLYLNIESRDRNYSDQRAMLAAATEALTTTATVGDAGP